MAALVASQKAAGYAFAAKSGALAARFGFADGQGIATVRDGSLTLSWPKTPPLSFRTVRFGRAGALAAVAKPSETRPQGQQVALERGDIEERYLAGPLGLEQSYQIASRVAGTGPLEFEVAFTGVHPMALGAAADRVALIDAQGKRRAVYRDLLAIDSKGRELPARMELKGGSVVLRIQDAEASYPLTVDPLIATQQQKFSSGSTLSYQYFGDAVAIDGDTAIVGAYGINSNVGSAYIFTRSGNTWSLQQTLTGPSNYANFGQAVAVELDTAFIGVPGKNETYVYARSGTTWSLQQTLTGSDPTTQDFGRSIALDGNTALIGADQTNSLQGAAYVFVFSGSTWSEKQELVSLDGSYNTSFGASVALNGDTALVGAYHRNGTGATEAGSAYVFTRSGTVWTQQQELVASDPAAFNYFGHSVALGVDTALIGAYGRSSGQGAAYFFTRSGTTWTEQQILTASDGAGSQSFAYSAVLAGNTALFGATGRNAAYIFTLSGTTWTQQAEFAGGDTAGGDNFGSAVAISGDTAIVGASAKSTYQGAAYAFVLTSQAANGAACSAASDCVSGFCADGLCCDTACGGGATDDCQACAIAAGASADGTCGPAAAGQVCRAAADVCDVAESCDGTSTDCPADAFEPATTECRAAADICDVAETCTGSAAACPADAFAPATTECRAAADICDVAETCTGSAAACPADAFAPATTECRAAAGVCDVAEMCTGSAAACPADAFRPATTECRASAGVCDVAETCTGSAAACPADAFMPATTECRASAGICDLAEMCTGSAATCPNDAKVGPGTVCRGAADVCDLAESCDGSSNGCPADAFKPATTECRASAGPCDLAEMCTGSAAACPNDAKAAPGTECRASAGSCDVAESCDGSSDTCPADADAPSGTACTDDSNPCTADLCDASGGCTHASVTDGTACNGGQVCYGGTCGAGCVIGGSVFASGANNPANACQSCQPGTSPSTWTNVADQTACDDGSLCTSDDVCTNGLCAGTRVTFDAGEPCYAASCNIQDGGEILTALDGTGCDDGRDCSGPDVCRNGVCTPDTNTCACSSDLDCSAPTQCQASVSCDLATGTCVYANQPDGTGCDDGSACTRADACAGGVCLGSDPVTCVALDACHIAGSCIPEDGGCTNPVASDDAGCDDGRTCTTADHCSAGACVAGDTSACACSQDADCPAPTQCQASVSCDAASGTCVYVNMPDDAGCDDSDLCTSGEHCVSGVCGSPSATVTCQPLDQCHVAGSCDPATGVCTNPIADGGTACDDGRSCTTDDVCQAGVCVGDATACACTSNADCAPLDECHTAGTCDLSTGTCSRPAKPDGTACDDQNACTFNETCQAGTCAPAVTLNCPGANECQDAQTCDSASSSCVRHPLPDGTACDGGSCQSGACVASGSSGGTSEHPADNFNVGGSGCGCGATCSDPFSLAMLLGLALASIRRRPRRQ